MPPRRTGRQRSLAKDENLELSHELVLMAFGKMHVISHLGKKPSGILDHHLSDLYCSVRLQACSYETLYCLYLNFNVVEQLCLRTASNAHRDGPLSSYFRLIASALLRPGRTQLNDGFVQETLGVMKQMVADLTPALDATARGLLDGVVDDVVAGFTKALEAADGKLTAPPTGAAYVPIHSTQVVKHRDELENAFELHRLCFQAYQLVLENSSDAQQGHGHSQRTKRQSIRLPPLERALGIRDEECSESRSLGNVIRLSLSRNNTEPSTSFPWRIIGISPGIQHSSRRAASTAAIKSSSKPASSTSASAVKSASLPPPSSLHSQSTSTSTSMSMSMSTSTSAPTSASMSTAVPQHKLDPFETQLNCSICMTIITCADAYGGLQDSGVTKSENDVVVQLTSPLTAAFNTFGATARGTRIRISTEKSYLEPDGTLLRADITASDHLHSERPAFTIEAKKRTAGKKDKLGDIQKSLRFAVNQAHTSIASVYEQTGGDLAHVAELLNKRHESLASHSMTIVDMDYATTVQAKALPLRSLGEVMVVFDPQYRVVTRKELEAVVSEAVRASGFSQKSLVPGASTATAATRYKQCIVRAVNTLFMLAYMLDAEFMYRSMLGSEKFFDGLKPTARPKPLGRRKSLRRPLTIQPQATALRRSTRVQRLNQRYQQPPEAVPQTVDGVDSDPDSSEAEVDSSEEDDDSSPDYTSRPQRQSQRHHQGQRSQRSHRRRSHRHRHH
ncbi:hypothetical protein GQ42DRAFT_171455 [Ramicandelaber brevisporus]|nr:hypothetical protein GQ42DRAFT_171455 [Ramicandelaber brevisporus]